MEGQPPRHTGRRSRTGSTGKALRFVLTGALFSAALLGAALVLDDPRFQNLLDVRLGPGAGGQEAGGFQAGTAGDELLNPDGHLHATAVILHELSHVMGLDHVEDPTQLIYPEIGTPEGLFAGDLNGLFELSKARCRKDL